VTRRLRLHARGCERIPTPEDLDRAPELAILAALDPTLELAAAALVAAHPELCDPERPAWLGAPTRSAAIAQSLMRKAHGLQRATRDYRRAVEIPPREDPADLDDLEF